MHLEGEVDGAGAIELGLTLDELCDHHQRAAVELHDVPPAVIVWVVLERAATRFARRRVPFQVRGDVQNMQRAQQQARRWLGAVRQAYATAPARRRHLRP